MTKTNVEWALEISPPWMVGPVGELWTSALGFWFDMQAEAAVQAVKAAQLRSDTFHVSALPLIGNERQMPRYPIETDDQYNLRLRGAFGTWAKAGNFQAIIDQLAIIGLTAEIWEQGQNGPSPLQDSAAIWDWDDDTANWSRFFVVITGHPYTERVWDDGWTYDDGGTWGSDATVEDVQLVQSIVTHWKKAATVYPHIIIVMDQAAWDLVSPITTGDRYDIFANRSDSAIYWDGYGKRAY